MNYQHWIDHFHANRSNRSEPDWDAFASLTETQRKALASSLAEYQLGDGGGPCRLLARDAEQYRGQREQIGGLVSRRSKYALEVAILGAWAGLCLFLWIGHGKWLRVIGVTRAEFFLYVRAGLRRFVQSLAASKAAVRSSPPELVVSLTSVS